MKLEITRTDGIVEVMILRNKNDNTYSYINLTKGHICPCRFNTIDEALDDLKTYPKVVSWQQTQ
ncbi:hypothetical protein FDH01_gp274 [Acinetobacter phage vB_AbaM_ME3]|uniref:Uncharacterized protein n=1 Tax=Acinetobacter phage vB_AbaM_ME3 TaxID=1837876 RepID=A0A172Q0F9_9CAUD|nr:hypothetical protein FDH01_gp274 [Acinetobacter phage vB_AbaM_ME3]AND75348.1 hypothetical protein ME3_187 [Acinetobacter phage vB_AbaM_ME3]